MISSIPYLKISYVKTKRQSCNTCTVKLYSLVLFDGFACSSIENVLKVMPAMEPNKRREIMFFE